MTCDVCGSPLPEGARFCPSCGAVVGTPLGTEERKVVTVLFADLVGSTGIAQRLDPERVREVLGEFFDAASEELYALRGRPEKFIGDAVMAVFGLPTVHEDDALRAVRAGLAIRGRVQRMCLAVGMSDPLEVRVGVESGEAATGIGPAGQLLVTGPVVNAAARLQEAAEPGEVVVGETAFALTEDAVSYGERRDVKAKGFNVDLAAFPVEGLTTRSARRTIPFVGRASELALLRDGLAQATAAGQPVLATVIGEQGIGKSRLADEVVAGLGDDVTILTGRPRSYTDTATFAPAAAIVGELAGMEEGDPPDRVRARLLELAERTWGGPADPHVIDRLSLLFGLGDRRDESAFVNDVQAGFVALIDRLASERTIVLVFEDAHGLRASMLDLIERVGAPPRHGTRPALILVLARTSLLDARPSWTSGSANAVTIRLDPLSEAESIELVRQAAGRRIDEQDLVRIAERAGGNPFFIIETTGMILPDGDRHGHPTTAIPPTVQAVVAARIDHLPARLRELTRHASIFFVSFDLEELAIVDPAATEDDVRGLEEAEIVVREEGRRIARWRLRHSTLKDVAYASLPKRERVRLHQLVADRLMATGHPTWAADHLELAALASLDLDPDDRAVAERAVDALVAAGDRARRRMENRSAVHNYERALGLAAPEDRWGVREARALAGLGEARYWLGEYPAATETLERAVRFGTATNDPFTLALALRFLGDLAINVDADLDRAEELLDRSLAAAEELGDPWALARALLFAGWVPWTRERFADAELIWRRALEVADPDDGWARVRALNSLSINRTGGPGPATPEGHAAYEEALELSQEASALAEEIGDEFNIAMTSVQLARVLEDLGRLDEALACIDDAVGTFEDLGARWELGDAAAERGIIKREMGRLDEAEEDLWRTIRISEELGERQLASWTWRALARVSERRGEPAEAEERMRRSREADEGFRLARASEPQRLH